MPSKINSSNLQGISNAQIRAVIAGLDIKDVNTVLTINASPYLNSEIASRAYRVCSLLPEDSSLKHSLNEEKNIFKVNGSIKSLVGLLSSMENLRGSIDRVYISGVVDTNKSLCGLIDHFNPRTLIYMDNPNKKVSLLYGLEKDPIFTDAAKKELNGADIQEVVLRKNYKNWINIK